MLFWLFEDRLINNEHYERQIKIKLHIAPTIFFFVTASTGESPQNIRFESRARDSIGRYDGRSVRRSVGRLVYIDY